MTFWQSWTCKLYRVSPQGWGSEQAHNPASSPGRIPRGHTPSYCLPGEAGHPLFLVAEEKKKIDINFSNDKQYTMPSEKLITKLQCTV